MDNLIDTFQVARMLEYHPQTVRNLARTGVLPGIKRRQKWFFDPEVVKQWFFNHVQNCEQTNDQPQVADL
jgi:phage terminase Nu1 subunit (DNA packaging protein)